MGRKKGTTSPDCWISGPDPADHKLFYDCQRARAQAWYRGEQWEISEQDYIQLWRRDDQHLRKGRRTGDLCLIRLDITGPWSLANVEIVERHRHFRRLRDKEFSDV